MNQEQLRNSLTLYVPSNMNNFDGKDMDNYIESQKAIDQFLNAEITPNDLVQILGDVGKVDIDDWLDCVHYNLNVG